MWRKLEIESTGDDDCDDDGDNDYDDYDDGGGDELMMITVHGTFFYLNVEKMLVVERFLPIPPPPSLSRGFIAAKLI